MLEVVDKWSKVLDFYLSFYSLAILCRFIFFRLSIKKMAERIARELKDKKEEDKMKMKNEHKYNIGCCLFCVLLFHFVFFF